MRSKLLLICIALLASVCLWVYVVTVINPDGTDTLYGVPVIFSAEEDIRADRGLVITEGSTQSVNLKISGKRLVLQKLSSENVTVRVDVSRIKKIGAYELNYEIVFPSDVANSDVSVTDRLPELVKFTVEKLSKKTVEVRGVLDGKAADGFVAETMTFDVDEVLIEGPESVISQVSYAQVILTRTDVDKTVTASVPYTLVDANGNVVDVTDITADVEEIKVTLPVIKYKDVPLNVSFLAGGGATKDDVTYTISPETLAVGGDAQVIDAVSEILLGEINLATITDASGKKTFKAPIVLPDGLKNISGDEMAEVTVTITGLDTKVIRVSNMEFTHIAEGFTPEAMTLMLQITVRGPGSVISKISAADLRLVADLSEYTKEGSYEVPAAVYIDGFPKAGAVGEYKLVVMLRKE